MDQKSAFDAGFKAFESGVGEADGPGSADWTADVLLNAMWHIGWHRGRDDSCTALLVRNGNASKATQPKSRI